jgi:cell surface protein SprA
MVGNNASNSGDTKQDTPPENTREDKGKSKTTKGKEPEVLNKNPNATIASANQDDRKRKDSIAAAKKSQVLLDKKKKEEAKKKKKQEWVPSDGLRFVGGLVMMVKRATFSYTENQGTTLPGYMDSTQSFGMNMGNRMNPGAPFVFGFQPDRLWLEGKGNDNVLTRDSLFNAPFQQQYSQTFNFTANIEPVKDFKVDLTLTKTFNKGYTELFKDTVGGDNRYVHLNPYETGGFSISYIALNTIFQKRGVDNFTSAFNDFENNRKVISERLGIINPYSGNISAPEDEEYRKGYTRYSQDVLIPAFLSAYSGKDPKTYPLLNYKNEGVRSNPFKNILPMPNWRINYNGLSRLKAFKNIFQSFTLNHSYTGTLAMNSFNSSLMYRDTYALGFPSFIDSVSGNFVPYFMVPNMTINETLGPLLGIDATFKNSLNIHVDFKKARTLSMSLVDFQLSETKSSEITVGGGMRLKNVTINTRYFGLNKYKSDVNIKADFGLRDDYTTINRLDQRVSRATRGQKVITISPSIDYILTQSLTLRFFMDRRQSIPYVSNAFPITTTRGGVMIRFLLGQ